MSELPVVVAMTGASGVVYGQRLLDALLASGREVHLTISESCVEVFKYEQGVDLDLSRFDPAAITSVPAERLHYWYYKDFMAGVASGSFQTAGMAVCPCSTSTLAKIAGGQGDNLIHRAADVHLKERRKLVLMPRETPLSLLALENMVRVTRAGAVVLPASPGFYHRPKSVEDLVDFVVSRICDQLGVRNNLIDRWGTT